MTELGRRIVQISELAAAMHLEAALRGAGIETLDSSDRGMAHAGTAGNDRRLFPAVGRLVGRWLR